MAGKQALELALDGGHQALLGTDRHKAPGVSGSSFRQRALVGTSGQQETPGTTTQWVAPSSTV